MKSEIKVYDRGNGEIQRVQVVSWDDWSQLDFLWLKQENSDKQKKSLKCFYDIYHNYLIPACPWIFPQVVMFALPEEEEVHAVLKACTENCMDGESGYVNNKYGTVSDPLTIATILLQEGIRLKKGKPVFLNEGAKSLYQALEERGFVHIVCGKLPYTRMIPVSRFAGYLSQVEKQARLKLNAHFFIMDPFDCATPFDQIGIPFGLSVKDGVVTQPPLFDREALLVSKEGKVSIHRLSLNDLSIEVNGKIYVPGENTTLYTRPKQARTAREDAKLVAVVGNRVVAVKGSGRMEIPGAGFVFAVDKQEEIKPEDEVIYHGLEDIKFGIQVGNSIIRNGEKTKEFISKFYNIYHLERIPYPPCLFPMDFEKARAARMAIGADKDGKPVIFWAEGKGKIKYRPGEDSTGASLTEMAEIAEDLGLYNAVNLDGGGSAQILLNGNKSLHIADRNKEDNSDAERLIPLGLIVK